MYNLGDNFKNNNYSLLISHPNCTFMGQKYRITVLTERLIRFEYDPTGNFCDLETPLVKNRVFDMPTFIRKDEGQFLKIETKYFTMTYMKEAEFSMKTLFVDVLDTTNRWYYGISEADNYKACGKNVYDKNVINGLFSSNGYVSINDSKSVYIDENSNLIMNDRPKECVDMYLFVYNKDFGLCLRDYFELTNYPDLIPRYALGNWWSNNNSTSDQLALEEIDQFKNNNIPLSIYMLNDNWFNSNDNYDVKYGFTFDVNKFKNPKTMIDKIHLSNLKFGLKINNQYGFYPRDTYFEKAKEYLNVNEKGNIDFNIYDPKCIDVFFKLFLRPLENYGVDFFWNDFDSTDTENYLMNYYMKKNNFRLNKRYLSLMRNSNMGSHTFNVIYSGKEKTDWDTVKLEPFFNANSANIGITWWSHDVFGSFGGIETDDLFIRSIQLGVFSPIMRFDVPKGKYYKRAPWKWDIVTNDISSYYLRLRHQLIPYIYTEAHKYHEDGTGLLKPFYYSNLAFYDNEYYVNQYYFGSQFMISPVIQPMDELIGRTIQKFFMPEGVWYDFKNGKRYLGNHKYISFYKIEDYPIFVKSGSIIPLAGEESYMSYKNPKDFDIHVFPGVSNTYQLYEDDGESFDYRTGKYLITNIDYNYRKSNYTVIIRPLDGDVSVVPEKRTFRIHFRNTKTPDNIVVYKNEEKITDYTFKNSDSDFVIEVKDFPTKDQLVINCYGKDIEIDAVKLIKDDIDSIIYDLKIETDLKDNIASIIFDEQLDSSKKRIAIRKLKRNGLDKRSIKVFLKLLEYMEM